MGPDAMSDSDRGSVSTLSRFLRVPADSEAEVDSEMKCPFSPATQQIRWMRVSWKSRPRRGGASLARRSN